MESRIRASVEYIASIKKTKVEYAKVPKLIDLVDGYEGPQSSSEDSAEKEIQRAREGVWTEGTKAPNEAKIAKPIDPVEGHKGSQSSLGLRSSSEDSLEKELERARARLEEMKAGGCRAEELARQAEEQARRFTQEADACRRRQQEIMEIVKLLESQLARRKAAENPSSLPPANDNESPKIQDQFQSIISDPVKPLQQMWSHFTRGSFKPHSDFRGPVTRPSGLRFTRPLGI